MITDDYKLKLCGKRKGLFSRSKRQVQRLDHKAIKQTTEPMLWARVSSKSRSKGQDSKVETLSLLLGSALNNQPIVCSTSSFPLGYKVVNSKLSSHLKVQGHDWAALYTLIPNISVKSASPQLHSARVKQRKAPACMHAMSRQKMPYFRRVIWLPLVQRMKQCSRARPKNSNDFAGNEETTRSGGHADRCEIDSG